MRIKLRSTFAVAVGMALTGALLAPTSAQAASYPPLGWKTFNPSYSKGYCFYSKPLKRAMAVTIKGTLSYKRHAYKFNRGIRVRFHDPTLKNPTITLRTYNKCGKGRKVSKVSKVSKSKLEQIWYDYKCNTSVSVWAGFPWQAGIGVTRTCGKTKRAHRATDYGRGSSYTQSNSGAPAYWRWGSDGKGIDRGGKICLRADAASTIWVGNRSDSVIKPYSVCVTASWG